MVVFPLHFKGSILNPLSPSASPAPPHKKTSPRISCDILCCWSPVFDGRIL